MEKSMKKSMKTISVRPAGEIRLTATNNYCYACCCCGIAAAE
jgi:hypothetical protein